MSEPPPVEDSPSTGEPDEVTVASGAIPADPAATSPRLLVMPPAEELRSIVWPGPVDQPAWAIPVTVPPGTLGYAIFLPLLGPGEPANPPGTTSVTGTTSPHRTTGAAGTTSPSAPAATHAAGHSTTVPGPTEASRPTLPSPRTAETTPARTHDPAPAATTTDTPHVTVTAATTSNGTAATTPAPHDVPPRTETPPASAPASGTSPAGGTSPAAGTGPVRSAAGNRLGPPVAAAGPTGPPRHESPYAFRPLPPRSSFFDRVWPGPGPARDRATPLAVLLGALGVAALVPLGRTGVGWFLGWLILTAGVTVAVRRHTAEMPRAQRWVRAGWAAAALALLAVLAFRNAWWLVTFCVLGALGCAALAIVGGRQVRSILFSLVATPIAAARGLPWVRAHVRAPDRDPGNARRVVGSVAATVAVLVVFGALLSSADAAFSQALGAIVPEISVSGVFRWLFLAAVGALVAVAAVYTIAAPPDLSSVDRPTTRSLSLVEWAPPIATLTALFGGFVTVQFTVLFGGQRHVLDTTGLSYAEYARSGFWQLVAVTVLTLVMLSGVTRWACRDRRWERVVLRILLGLLSALSVVIVISALSRMYTYQKVYSFTGERIFVMAFELLLGAVFVMILTAGVRWRGGWIPGLTAALAAVMLLGLAALNPEGYAARRNVARYEQTGRIDAWYLRALSADATSALGALPDPVRRCTLSWIADDLAEPDPWYAWNLGRQRARTVLDRLGPDAIGDQRDCRRADQFDLPKSPR
ncbi:DUF4153 domain-containing protein [Micromonospora sp. LOL_024]|uniref:DUF4153 domain-containing protein n=1 Tax=Micromonospora sp. LOL_024 TaxID=3345412 RepID=UPI003A88F807